MLSALVQATPSLDLLLVNHRHKEIRREKHYSPVEFRWRDAEDCKRMLVQLNHAAHHGTIILKTAVPICVWEHDIRGAVGAMLIGAVEETTKIRLNAQYVEVVPAHFVDPRAGWIFARVQPCLIDAVSCQVIKAVVAIAQIEVVGVRLRRDVIPPALDCIKALLLRQIQWVQYQRIQHAKDYGVCADGHGQRQNRSESESGRLAQDAKAEAHVL